MVMVNPEITNAQGKDTMEEGCLSVPGVRLDVTRAESLDLAYTDLDGQRRSLHAEGMLAKVIQHEMDHLNGMLIVDRISSLKRQLIKKQLKELAAETQKTTRSAGTV
jgi:peptide deformylase